ncbi:MAG: hypothetical protein AAF125_25480 [Chloroflexota bacterium]
MTTQAMQSATVTPDGLLRKAIRANGIFCTTSGVLIGLLSPWVAGMAGIAGVPVLGPVTGVPFLIGLAVILAIYGPTLIWASGRETFPLWVPVEVLVLDIAWVALSAWVVLGNLWPTTTFGNVLIVLLADAVLVFIAVQVWGLRRMLRAR